LLLTCHKYYKCHTSLVIIIWITGDIIYAIGGRRQNTFKFIQTKLCVQKFFDLKTSGAVTMKASKSTNLQSVVDITFGVM